MRSWGSSHAAGCDAAMNASRASALTGLSCHIDNASAPWYQGLKVCWLAGGRLKQQMVAEQEEEEDKVHWRVDAEVKLALQDIRQSEATTSVQLQTDVQRLQAKPPPSVPHLMRLTVCSGYEYLGHSPNTLVVLGIAVHALQ